MQVFFADDPSSDDDVSDGGFETVEPAASTPAPNGERLDDDSLDMLERKRRDDNQRIEVLRAEMQAEDETLGRQRRENVRVQVQMPLMIHMSGRDAPGRTRDISATGVGFSTRLPVELDQRGEVTIQFEDWSFTNTVVIRFMKPILAGNVIGAQFERLSEEERERLVKQVFDVQRAQLRNDKQR